MNLVEPFRIDASRIGEEAMGAWARELGSLPLARQICQTSRVSERALRRILDLNGMDDHEIEVDPIDQLVFSRFLKDPAQIIRQCGLVFYGSTIRLMISGADYQKLASLFSHAELSAACELKRFHSSTSIRQNDAGRLPALIENAGKQVMGGWFSCLAPDVRKAFKLLASESQIAALSVDVNIDTFVAAQLARSVIDLLQRQDRTS
jgi:hypothetical protein